MSFTLTLSVSTFAWINKGTSPCPLQSAPWSNKRLSARKVTEYPRHKRPRNDQRNDPRNAQCNVQCNCCCHCSLQHVLRSSPQERPRGRGGHRGSWLQKQRRQHQGGVVTRTGAAGWEIRSPHNTIDAGTLEKCSTSILPLPHPFPTPSPPPHTHTSDSALCRAEVWTF